MAGKSEQAETARTPYKNYTKKPRNVKQTEKNFAESNLEAMHGAHTKAEISSCAAAAKSRGGLVEMTGAVA